MKKEALILAVGCVAAATWVRAGEGEAGPVVSCGPQLFLDDELVGRMENVRREVQRPVKHPANPLVVQEFPWEKRTIQIYGTVLYEAAAGKFRMWYLASEDADSQPEYYMCYAESEDGIRWKKPMVGTVPMAGHAKHNMVIPGGHGMCVLPTPEEADAGRRYKGLGGNTLAFSPDGIRWAMKPFRSAGKNDTSSCVVRWKGEYLAYVRNQVPEPAWPGVMRGVALSVSRDFEEWTAKETIFVTDKEDGYPWTQPYGMAVTPYGDQLIGLVWFIHLDRKEGNNSVGDMDMQLVSSRDGRRWSRVADRGVFLAPTKGTWDRGRVFPGTTLVVKDDLIYVYYTGADTRHGESYGRPGIGLATLPADRFVALRPAKPDSEGIVETRAMRFSGKTLLVNAEVEAGDLRVEVVDENGAVVAGFEREACRLTAHDKLRYRVVWGAGDGAKGLGELRRPAALRFMLRRGALYAYQVVE